MQSQSCSSFYTQLRQAYAPVMLQQRSDLMRVPSPLQNTGVNSNETSHSPPVSMIKTSSPPLLLPAVEGPCSVSAITELQRKLAAIQEGNRTAQNQSQSQPQPQQQQQNQNQRPFSSYSLAPQDREVMTVGELGAIVEHKTGSCSLVSTLSSRSSNDTHFNNNQAAKVGFSVATRNKRKEDDEALTPKEMAFLRIIEFSASVALYAQLEPGVGLVEVCARAIVKLFPRHLVFIRPDGVAVVELVIEELCELNEDEGACSLDCIVQTKNTTHRQLIRAICTDTIARGALFKLVSARRSQLEEAKQQEKRVQGR